MNISKEKLQAFANDKVPATEWEKEMARYILELQKQEPVAWRCVSGTIAEQRLVTLNKLVADHWRDKGHEVIPLYAAPVPPAASQPDEPVQWGAPKTVRQLIRQLQTLEPELETTALLRMPADFRDGKAIRQVPLSISYEKMEGVWLASYKGDGRKVIAFWAKPDDRCSNERGEVITASQPPAVPEALRIAINKLFDNDGSRGCYDAIDCGRAHREIEAMLTAAPKHKDGDA